MSLKVYIGRLVKAAMKITDGKPVWVGKNKPWLEHTDVHWIDTSSKPPVMRKWNGQEWGVIKE